MSNNQLATVESQTVTDMLFDTAGFQRRLNAIDQREKLFEKIISHLKPGVDYDKAFGDSKKDTLLKPGAETICGLLGLRVGETLILDHSRDFDKVASGVGSSNSYESKHRRWVDAKEATRRGFSLDTLKSKTYQDSGKTTYNVPMDDSVIDNTVLKMAKKRALVDAVLSMGFSRFFTQDLDDIRDDSSQRQQTTQRQPTGQNGNQPTGDKQPSNANEPISDWKKFYRWALDTHFLADIQVNKALEGVNRGKITKGEAIKLIEAYVAAAASAPPAQPKSAPPPTANEKLPDTPESPITNEETAFLNALMENFEPFGMDFETAVDVYQSSTDYTLEQLIAVVLAFTEVNDDWDLLPEWLNTYRPQPQPEPKKKIKQAAK
jgi:hypothetical protein